MWVVTSRPDTVIRPTTLTQQQQTPKTKGPQPNPNKRNILVAAPMNPPPKAVPSSALKKPPPKTPPPTPHLQARLHLRPPARPPGKRATTILVAEVEFTAVKRRSLCWGGV